MRQAVRSRSRNAHHHPERNPRLHSCRKGPIFIRDESPAAPGSLRALIMLPALRNRSQSSHMSDTENIVGPSRDTWKKTFRTYYPQWRLLDDRYVRQPPDQVARDLDLAREFITRDLSDPAPPLYRIWTNRRCLVATRREERLPAFEEAAAASAERGWPVVLRDSGGTVVPHDPAFLQLTLLLPRLGAEEPGTDEIYRLLCGPVMEALAALKVPVGYGEVPRSFCDGRFNLVSRRRKLAGTAQRWRGGIPGHPVREGMILAHLTLFVDGDLPEATRAVNRFLQEAGGKGNFDSDAMITVVEARHGLETRPPVDDLDLARVRAQLADVLAR